MKKTLGQYFGFKVNDYPITLNFNDFYYYENSNHNHILLYIPTGKMVNDFYMVDNLSGYLLNRINDVFQLNLSEIEIYRPFTNEVLCKSKLDSEWVYTKSINGLGCGANMVVINFGIDLLWDTTNMTDDDKADKEQLLKHYLDNLTQVSTSTRTNSIETEQKISETDQARPPT